jgi:hypothetical protein
VGGHCRLPKTCDELQCPAGQVCWRPANEDARCDTGCVAANGRPGIPDGAGGCVGCPETCDGDPAGQDGPYLEAATRERQCICRTKEGYYWSVSPQGVYPCDADGDGWVRIGAQLSIHHNDPVIQANARCELRKIKDIVLHNEAGQLFVEELAVEALPLYESRRNDDQAELDAGSTTPAYGERRLQAAELNCLTRACVGANADYNDNEVEDVDEWQEMDLPPATPGHDTCRPFVPYSYFVELHRGWYEHGAVTDAPCLRAADCAEPLVCDLGEHRCRHPGRYHIAEKSRQENFPLRLHTAEAVVDTLPAGCADGTREGFVSKVDHPLIAGCAGGWEVLGVRSESSREPTCAREGGNDGPRPGGSGCSVADLCAEGWHVCEGPADVAASSPRGCRGALPDDSPPQFFATRASGPGYHRCDEDGANDVLGCGNYGREGWSPSCGPLTRQTGDLCTSLHAPWDCGEDGTQEAQHLVKSGPEGGGVLCCQDAVVGCADGQREGFLSLARHPSIAGCAGAWKVAGVRSGASRVPQCGRRGGDDGDHADGEGCSVADLCAAGWHVCEKAAEVAAVSLGGCAGAIPEDPPAEEDGSGCGPDLPCFFATRQSGSSPAGDRCGNEGTSGVFGCGDLGKEGLDTGCRPLDRATGTKVSGDGLHQCQGFADAQHWSCGQQSGAEAENLVKFDATQGGALCCRDRSLDLLGDSWRTCPRRRDAEYASATKKPGFDFARFSSGDFSGMNHHSQFRCLKLLGPQDGVADQPNEGTAAALGDAGYLLDECRAEGSLTPAGQPADPQVRCSVLEPLPERGVFWGVTRFLDYPVAGRADYLRGCVNECTERFATCPACAQTGESCPVLPLAPAALQCVGDPRDFGKLQCGCTAGFGGSGCEVACPSSDLLLSATFAPSPRRGYWLCGRVSTTTYPDGGPPLLVGGPEGGQFRLRGEVAPGGASGALLQGTTAEEGLKFTITPLGGGYELQP